MKEIKTTKKTEAREAYEPVQVKVMKITPQGLLCGSGTNANLQSYNKGITQ